MKKGDKVMVAPAMLPNERFPGVILRAGRRPGVWRVRYESYGAFYNQEFYEARLEIMA